MIKRFTAALMLTVAASSVIAQVSVPTLTEQTPTEEKGQFSGNFQSNFQGYVKDSAIGANTTQYEKELSSADAWLFLNYKYRGFNFSLRYDVFNNTPLFDPFKAYTQSGVGYWQLTKDIDKFNITVGNFYDQFGSGIIFRAYEDRNIGIDFSVMGARVIYNPSENTRIKLFTGQQKFLFDRRTPVIKGLNIEHRLNISENLIADLGASVVNRTIDQVTMNTIASTINSYQLPNRFDPTYNVFGFNGYSTLSYKKYRFYFEYAKKTPEALMGLDQRLFKSAGDVYYTSLSYSTKGVGISAQYRRINNFQFRTSPLETNPLPSYGALINYLPALTRQNTYKLLARYNAVMQELGENAMQLEMTFKPNKYWQINVNGAATTALSGVDFSRGVDVLKWDSTTRLFREFYIDATHKFSNKLKVMAGVQFIGYNQTKFELKAAAPFVEAFTPFGEITYKITNQRSLRIEGQYLTTKQDLGNLVNLLVEFNVAPNWSFSVSDMVNTQHGALNKPNVGEKFKFVHYYNFFAAYTHNSTRITAAWLKQVAGVNCTGGVCRVEPAFSGARITLTTNF